jgi:stage V sporulation protein D (sporulation-specific penicillin-binding protein)
VRSPDGEVRYHHEPRPVRRVVAAEVAAEVRRFLRAAAGTGGTGSRAQLDRFMVIGKTGTARNVVGRTYTSSYTASFAGIFPADDPLLVVVIRIVNPMGGEYYGGLVAAPLTRRMLQDALSARWSTLDRRRLAERAPEEPVEQRAEAADGSPIAPIVVSLPYRAPAGVEPAIVEVPEVRGLTVRRAALVLHRRGFRVQLRGDGVVKDMLPAAGDSAASGSRVILTAEARRTS